MVGPQVEWAGGHQYPPGSLGPKNGSESSRPKNLLKIVSCAESVKLKEPVVGVEME